jgi:pimeloyl-ACP methyl ester carboxylesterase
MNRHLTFLLILLTGSSLVAYAQRKDSLQFFTSFDGTKINYEAKGSGDAVFLLHGFTGTIESWKKSELYKDLLNGGYKVVNLSMRGNGLSDAPHKNEAYQNDAEAKDIIELANVLKIKRYHVIGYSRGAIIASRVRTLDKRVLKTVLGGMGSDFMDPQWPRRIMFAKALSGDSIPELTGVVKSIRDRGIDQQAQAFLQYNQPSTSKEEFAKVKTPVLVICGDKDEDNGSSKDLATVISGSDYVRVLGDHNGTSRTKEFSTAVITFIKKK